MNIRNVTGMPIYEKDGVELTELISLTVKSHWNRSNMVVIVTPDGTSYCVEGCDLRRAVENCTNV